MGVRHFETYLKKSPPEVRREVNIAELASEYTQSTGKRPIIAVDGRNLLRSVHKPRDNEWMLGGQMKALVQDMQSFVSKFQKIGVDLVFFFDGATRENKRSTWLRRRQDNMKKIVQLFRKLQGNFNQQYMIPPLFGATGAFVAKFECGCDVRLSLFECDAAMAEEAHNKDYLGIISRDTDFVFLKGARYYFSSVDMNPDTMKAIAYNRKDLQTYLGLKPKQLLMLASLIGNDLIPPEDLKNFQSHVCPTNNNIVKLVPCLVEYIKHKYTTERCETEDLCHIASDVFGNETRAQDLRESILSYLPSSAEETDHLEPSSVAELSLEAPWRRILDVARQKHESCSVTTHLYPVMIGEAFELSTALENYRFEIPHTAAIYRPLRQRIYGILLHEKPGAAIVKEWCIGSNQIPTEPLEVPIIRPDNHPGLLHLWDESCPDDTKWRLFVDCLTRQKKLDASKLQELGFPFAVPVAVIHYLQQAMPWFYFDGKMLLQKYVEATQYGKVEKALCSTQKDVLASFEKMKEILNSV
ncbi:constitutive coactivator of peroxisome proliferator-activated receptor gamma-like isoform X2 [Periplaneta americana]|uniref:constitutive coactivator of peroxisome proliferator-activated receptor gamma-like isoform X2 n=1 Tax=Periplaneta americana TaxID=6978 RepID=UPI0037E7ED3A